MPDQLLTFLGEPVQIEPGEGPLVIRGRDAALLVEELARLLRFEEAARSWYHDLILRVPATTFLSLRSFP